MSFSQQYNAVGSLTDHSQRTTKPFSVWTWWIVNLTQGHAVRNQEGGRERAYPELWEVHQNSHCSSSSRCRQSWACLRRLSAELLKEPAPRWCDAFLCPLWLFLTLLRSPSAPDSAPDVCMCSLALTSTASLCALAADSSSSYPQWEGEDPHPLTPPKNAALLLWGQDCRIYLQTNADTTLKKNGATCSCSVTKIS